MNPVSSFLIHISIVLTVLVAFRIAFAMVGTVLAVALAPANPNERRLVTKKFSLSDRYDTSKYFDGEV